MLRRAKVLGIILSMLMLCTGCSDSTSEVSTTSTVSLEDKYKDIVLYLASLKSVVENNMDVLLQCANGIEPASSELQIDMPFDKGVSDFVVPSGEVISSYTGYDWVNEQGIIVCIVQPSKLCRYNLRATFTRDLALVEASVFSYEDLSAVDSSETVEVSELPSVVGSNPSQGGPISTEKYDASFRDDEPASNTSSITSVVESEPVDVVESSEDSSDIQTQIASESEISSEPMSDEHSSEEVLTNEV